MGCLRLRVAGFEAGWFWCLCSKYMYLSEWQCRIFLRLKSHCFSQKVYWFHLVYFPYSYFCCNLKNIHTTLRGTKNYWAGKGREERNDLLWTCVIHRRSGPVLYQEPARFCPAVAERATLWSKSKTGTRKSWYRFPLYCLRVLTENYAGSLSQFSKWSQFEFVGLNTHILENWIELVSKYFFFHRMGSLTQMSLLH